MKLLSWNVNGIRAVERKGFLDWLEHIQPDVLCLQETKAHPEQLSKALLEPEGYFSYFHSSSLKKGYSGVVTYSRKEPKNVEYGLLGEKFDAEGRVVMTEFDKFVLFNVYFPNGKASSERLNYKLEFYDAFLKKIDSFKEKGIKVIFCGDVNTAHKEIDLSHPKNNEKTSGFLPIERKWIDRVIEHGYLDSLREFHKEPEIYTWWDMKTRARERNIGWRIDYFFVQKELRKHMTDAFIMPDVMGSDHCPLGITLDF
ncbi:exodeoxyribonuclease III [Candidatus Peregrinibacteria bacterium]|nr:exodeoxyribonuclease III [Candidatus Peregrinibacteria bacterium]